MAKQTGVLNIAGDYEESILRFADHLGSNVIRRKVFDVIYGRGTKPKSPKQIMEKAGLPRNKSQQVTNALNDLSKHNLIEKTPNDGDVGDRSRYLYSKVEAVRANKEKIIRFADNPSDADKIATKRRPSGSKAMAVLPRTRKELKGKKKFSVVYLTANPSPDGHLQIDREIRLVQEAIRGSIFRDSVSVYLSPAADLPSIMDGLNDKKPEIVHFSGHGNPSALAMDDQSVETPGYQELSYSLLAKALRATDKPPKILVLNSCYGSSGKDELLEAVDVLVSMKRAVSDPAALAFAPRFYAALASGQSVQSAFQQGKIVVENASITEKDTPEMFVRADVDPGSLTLT